MHATELAEALECEARTIEDQARTRCQFLRAAAAAVIAAAPATLVAAAVEPKVRKRTVQEMIVEAAKTLPYPIDYAPLKARLMETLGSEERDRAVRGIYAAIGALVRMNDWHRVPGGYAIGPKPEARR